MLDLLQLEPTITSESALYAAVAAISTGLLAAFHYYRRTGTVPLKRLPLRAVRRLIYTVRALGFTVDGRWAAFDPGTDGGTAKRYLGQQSFMLEWPFSYNYKGEDINASRYYYDPASEYPHRQLHIRCKLDGDGVVAALHAHDEASALHHPRAHLRGGSFTHKTEWVIEQWDTSDPNSLDPRTIE